MSHTPHSREFTEFDKRFLRSLRIALSAPCQTCKGLGCLDCRGTGQQQPVRKKNNDTDSDGA